MPTFKVLISRVEYMRGYIEIEAENKEEIQNMYFSDIVQDIDYGEFDLVDASDDILSIEKIGDD